MQFLRWHDKHQSGSHASKEAHGMAVRIKDRGGSESTYGEGVIKCNISRKNVVIT